LVFNFKIILVQRESERGFQKSHFISWTARSFAVKNLKFLFKGRVNAILVSLFVEQICSGVKDFLQCSISLHVFLDVNFHKIKFLHEIRITRKNLACLELRWSLIKNFEIQYGSFKGSIKWGGETNYLTTGILQNCTESTIMVSYTQPEDKVSFYPRLIFLSIILQCFFSKFL